MNETYIVGLTGGIGSGKSTVADLFGKLDVPLIDADVVARQVVEKGSATLAKIVEHFGNEILTFDGNLDRSKLRQIIFSDNTERLWLNNLLHPAIRQEIRQQITQIKADYLILVVPLLIENNLTSLCDRILVVDIEPAIQIERVMQRDKNNKEMVQRIMQTQVSREERLAYADDIIENNGSLASHFSQLQFQVKLLHPKYIQLAKEKRCQKLL